jgi:hypothetical protein
MKMRCLNKNNTNYKLYGGRGITVCDDWLDFVGFWEDMGEFYRDGLELDRIDNNGNYEPGNCRWEDWKQQANNRSKELGK